ncbi:catalase [Streptomyces somaliensis]|uniref:catalase n=1 Tax=Streptomyces somaliensis TaxID=78355 RepID=UPI0034E94813
MVLDPDAGELFAENEQISFGTGVLVDGLDFSDDKMLVGRTFSYSDTQRYRVGPNYLQLPVNHAENSGRPHQPARRPDDVPRGRGENLGRQLRAVRGPAPRPRRAGAGVGPPASASRAPTTTSRPPALPADGAVERRPGAQPRQRAEAVRPTVWSGWSGTS